jgi:hypothetical protein
VASISAQIAAFARQVARPGNAAAQVVRTPKLSMHQVTVVASDIGTNTAHIQFNGTDEVTEGIRVIPPYVPAAGDIAWGFHNGTDFSLWGRHEIPNSTVILP